MSTCVVCTVHQPAENSDECTARCKHTPAKVGLVCAQCAKTVRQDLDDVAAAYRWLYAHPAGSSTAASSGSERPLPGGAGRLDWIAGPELPTFLSCWVHIWADPDVKMPTTVLAMVAWLRTDVEHRGFSSDLIKLFAHDLHRWADRGRGLACMSEPGQYVRCPTITVGEGECGRRLRIDVARQDEPVECRACGRTWTTARLIGMAERSSEDVWMDVDALELATHVPGRTARRWAARGLVRRWRGMYSLRDTVAAKEVEVIRYARKAVVVAARIGS